MGSGEWYDEISRLIADQGYRQVEPPTWATWPWEEGFQVRALDQPQDEPPRRGEDGTGCYSCAAADDPQRPPAWSDELAMVLPKLDGTSIPFLAFLMPRRHTDLSGLTDTEAARIGVLLARLEQSVCEVLDVPRVQAARWGDGSEHLHWWVYGRPTGVLQLRGTLLALWEDLLPLRDPTLVRRDLDQVMSRFVELVGGEANPGPHQQ